MVCARPDRGFVSSRIQSKGSTMNRTSAPHLSVLLAGLLAVAGVQAQTAPAAGTTDLPPKAGEASNQTRGVPNMAPSNSPVSEAPRLSKDQIREDAQGRDAASATTSVPGRAGEASTMVRGRPNDQIDQRARTRDEVRAELLQRRQMYDAARHQARGMGYGTVTNGGTPK
jgi:hypothetical protein